ncbi:MAG TPA: folylpolyglutamate synthase/dihydrofolate synthase family protein [Actinomycetota bacterium]|nr:folylpolyglutamate synthase/dihydrofolate synthase family protein [Actinomycetota bacterium]
MRFAEAVADLDARQPSRMVPDLDRIRALVDLLDHPEHTYPSIHVTGTNGKTSTARLIARILCGHGLATGVYTSPHLHSVTERLALCDHDVTEEEFAETYAHLEPYLREIDAKALGGERVTYFEALTALAFLWFADKPADAGVFEVGMGGEWDATNVIEAKVAVFCSIDLDHPELGSTVEEVAREKAGIIDPEAAVVVQDPDQEALPVIEARAAERGARILLRDRDFRLLDRRVAVGGQQIAVAGTRARYRDLVLPLHGPHQALNAVTAIVAAEAFLGAPLAEDVLEQALAGATSPGRLEIIDRHPLVVLDGAHNRDAARALAEALPEAFVWRRLHLVIGVLETKDVAGILASLAARVTRAHAAPNSNPKALSADRMADACRAAGIDDVEAHSSVAVALQAALAEADEEDLILVTGSLYTVADARPRLPRST